MRTKKIVILGPESSGKTTLAAALSGLLGCPWLPEQARIFLEQAGGDYRYDDLFGIAGMQMKAEKELEEEGAPIFILDTDLRMIRVWSEYVFGRCDNRILSWISSSTVDLYLLCSPDFPWQSDSLREHPQESDRRRIFLHYLEMLSAEKTPFRILEGSQEDRLKAATEAARLLS